MFSALTLIIIVSEMLKRVFKESEIKKAPVKSLVEELTGELEKISEAEEVTISAAVKAYLSETPHVPQRFATLKRGTQPLIWNIAGRINLTEQWIRRDR